MYHEKQNFAHCAVHSLNNLFQIHWISYNRLNKIANELYRCDKESGLIESFSFNPYVSQIPYLGYFDIACIIKALEEKNCELTQHIITLSDLQSFNLSTSSDLVPSNFIGLIINEMNSSLFGLWNGRHWFTIIFDQTNNYFVNLDSNLDFPDIIGNENELKYFLERIIRNKQAQIFVVSKTMIE